MAASLELLDDAIRDAAKELVLECGQAGLLPRVTSTLRSNAEQTRLYRAYLSGQGGYPVAPPGMSAHEYGLAFDMVLADNRYLRDVADVWISWGGGWNPADAIHFEAQGASDLAKQLFQSGIEQQDPTALKALDFLLSLLPTSGPWWSGFIPTKYLGTPHQTYTVGALGDILKSLGVL